MFSSNLIDIVKTIPNARVIEIGVARGETAFKILSCENVDYYYGVDPYELYDQAPSGRFNEGYLDLKMVKVPISDGTMQNLKKDCITNLSGLENRYSLIEKYSHEAVGDIQENVDLIYIDGNHQYEYVMDDLEIWYPKLKQGGLLIGDDYLFSGGPITEGYGGKKACEVDRACHDFCEKHNLKFQVVDGNFIIRKP